MTEALLMAAVQACGFLLVLPLSRLSVTMRSVLAFPVGLTTWLVVGLAMVVAPTSYRPGVSLLILGILSIMSASYAVRHSGTNLIVESLPWVLGLGVAAYLLSLGYQALNATAITPDSIRYLLGGEALARTGSATTIPPGDLLRRGVLVSLMHAPAILTHRQYLESVTPLLATSGLALFLTITWQALAKLATPYRWRWWLLGAAGLTFLGSNRGLYDTFYINGHLLFAVCLLSLTMGYWMMAQTSSVQWLLPALPGVAVMVALRPEGVLVVAPFLIVALAHDGLPSLGKWLPVIPYAGAAVIWFGFFLIPVRHTRFSITQPEPGLLMVALAVGALAAIAVLWPRSLLIRIAPTTTLIFLAGLLLLAVLANPAIARASLEATASNLSSAGRWGLTWLVILPTLFGVASVSRLPDQRLWTVPLSAFGILFFLLPYFREGAYRVGRGDSGNRMLMHVFFVVLAYLTIAAGGAVTKRIPMVHKKDSVQE